MANVRACVYAILLAILYIRTSKSRENILPDSAKIDLFAIL